MTSKNLKNGEIDFSTVSYISEEDHQNFIKRSKVDVGDILFAMIGSIGNPVKVNIAKEFSIKNVALFKPFVKSTNMDYVLLFLQFVQGNLQKDAKGGMQPFIPLSYFRKDLYIPLPPEKEQETIVSEVEKLLTIVDNIEQSKQDLSTAISQTKNRILDLAIHGKLVPQDANDEPASELLKRINPKAVASCDNPHYEDIPESWVECKLGDVCSFESGYAYSSEMYKPMGIPLIRISNIVDGLVNIEDCVYIKGNELSKNVQVKQGDLLIAMSGATTGKIGIYAKPNDAILNQRVGNIRVKELSVLSTGYRDLFINAIKVEIEKKAYGGAQPNISGKMICDFSFSLPPYYEQLRIVSKVNELFSKLDMIEKSL